VARNIRRCIKKISFGAKGRRRTDREKNIILHSFFSLNENVDLHGGRLHLPGQLEAHPPGLGMVERVERLLLSVAEDDLGELLGLAQLPQHLRQAFSTAQRREVQHGGEGQVESGQYAVLPIRDVLFRIPDPVSEFFHPGSRVKKIPDLDPNQRTFNLKHCF
jgi:hypothetical protein